MAELDGKDYWLVGAVINKVDQTERFIREGIWECRTSSYKEMIKSIKAGDKIAIKAAYTRQKGLPFDNHGKPVSVMSIKAVGTVTENLQDGQRIKVKWKAVTPPREWYFYTWLKTIWRVRNDGWAPQALIHYVFYDGEQDIDMFRNAGYWRDRFGDESHTSQNQFQWTRFYQAIADKLLAFKENRTELVRGIHEISERLSRDHAIPLRVMMDKFPDGTEGP